MTTLRFKDAILKTKIMQLIAQTSGHLSPRPLIQRRLKGLNEARARHQEYFALKSNHPVLSYAEEFNVSQIAKC